MELIKYENKEINIIDIENQIIQCKNIEDVKIIEAKVDAIFNYLNRLGRLTLEQANEIKALRFKTEWKIGQLLKALGEKRGKPDMMSSLNIKYKQSERYQTLAELNYEDIEDIKGNANKENIKLLKKDLMDRALGIKNREKNINIIKEKINNENIEIKNKYDVVILDPPWKYGREYDPNNSRVASPYPEQTKGDIYNTCKDMFKDDSVLWLWTTHQFIWEAKELLSEWGFTYKATLVWDKENIGMGSWLRMQCEFCLLGIKGTPLFENTTERDIIREQRKEHSRKPKSFYELVKKVCYGSIFEYYSREKKDGIITHGVEDGKLG